MSNPIRGKSEKLQGLMGGLMDKSDEVERVEAPSELNLDKIDISSVFAPTKKTVLVPKGFTIREDQVRDIEIYSKRANKNESEFVRDLLDLVFKLIKEDKK